MIHRSGGGFLHQSSLVLKYLEGFDDTSYITGNDTNPQGIYTFVYMSPVIMRVILMLNITFHFYANNIDDVCGTWVSK